MKKILYLIVVLNLFIITGCKGRETRLESKIITQSNLVQVEATKNRGKSGGINLIVKNLVNKTIEIDWSNSNINGNEIVINKQNNERETNTIIKPFSTVKRTVISDNIEKLEFPITVALKISKKEYEYIVIDFYN